MTARGQAELSPPARASRFAREAESHPISSSPPHSMQPESMQPAARTSPPLSASMLAPASMHLAWSRSSVSRPVSVEIAPRSAG